MAIQLPLHERTLRKNTLQKSLYLLILVLLLSLVVYRLTQLNDHGVVWLLAFLCESWFTFNWILVLNCKWNPVEFKTYPDRLLVLTLFFDTSSRVPELPQVDLFVTTADAVLEPPIITVNTVLSMLALDYPANKLACYVSDDGASPITFYALMEAIKFAKHWIPFCKKYSVMVRAPFRYFSRKESEACDEVSSEFQKDWMHVKNEYEKLCRKIEEATQNPDLLDSTSEFAAFSKIDRGNHPSIVEIIWENKENSVNGVPHLVYVSREKRPNHPHYFKAGAMNVLTKVSGLMTNAPFMLNVDCDMFANNPQIAQHAMCILLDNEKYAYVQSPQCFYGGQRDDPFGNQLIVIQAYLVRGFAGIQGPLYMGTGCFHRRKVIYGLSPEEKSMKTNGFTAVNGKSEDETLKMNFGNSLEFTKLAAEAMSGKHESYKDLSRSLKVAIKVADCSYESNTSWGKKIGWVYGSLTEDVLTGLGIHARGWKSAYCTPNPPAFLGCAPTGGTACLIHQKRAATGLLEIHLGNNSPIVAFLTRKLSFRQCLAYLYFTVWGLRSIPELCYSLLPVYCFLTNTSFMPKVTDMAILIPTSIFVVYNLHTMFEYLNIGLPISAWWNNTRMMRIATVSAWPFGVLAVILKFAGLSDTVFEVTRKETSNEDDDTNADRGRFTFDDSSLFVIGTTLVLVHITSLAVGLLQVYLQSKNEIKFGAGEIVCSAWVLLSLLPFLKGLFRKGKYGIPTSTICKAVAFVGLFVHFCIRGSRS